uniref:Adenylate kinase n=1 Tax=Ditylenchus dipsaci TaxID=166011 RepID=A0A915CNA1_9BILA
MGAEAKKYLQDHSIPQLFEGLMTGLIYNKPEDPINFLESAIHQIRGNPDLALKWDSFVDFKPEALPTSSTADKIATDRPEKGDKKSKSTDKLLGSSSKKTKPRLDNSSSPKTSRASDTKKKISQSSTSPKSGQSPHQNGYTKMLKKTSSMTSVSKAAEVARIPPDAPIILFIGGPGGGKTRYAAKVREMLEDQGLVHICMPDLIREGIAKYKDRFAEWREASERYQRGELIPNNLAQDLVKAEMGKHPFAKAYFLEGFPREARQVEDFERNVCPPVNMAMILDYDEDTLRRHMENRGLLKEVIDRRISEFKQKTLPSAKYFDDQRLLHLIPGEKDDSIIFERMQKLVIRALEAGVSAKEPITITPVMSGGQSPEIEADQQEPDGVNPSESQPSTSPIVMSLAGDESQPNTAHTPTASTPPVTNGISAVKRQTPVPSSPLATSSNSKRPETSGSPSTMQARRPSTQSLTSKPVEVVQQERKENGSVAGNPKAKRIEELALKSRSGSAASQASVKSRPGSISSVKSHAGNDVSTPTKHPQSPTTSVKTEKNEEKVEVPVTETTAALAAATISPSPNTANPSDRFPRGLPSNAPVILIIGAPGSEKSQFAQKIAKKYDGFIHISMGDLFRRKVLQNNEDELWTRIGKKMDVGEVIPMKICRELLYTTLHEIGTRSWGYVIEGYPRTLPQAEDIEAQLGRLDLAILIDCTEQYCKDTLKKRYLAAKEEGAERSDDEESVVKIRLGLFKQNTLPMLKYLDDKGKLRVIEGDGGVDKVFQEITNAIDNAVFIEDGGSGKSLNSSKQASVVDSPLK